jgi:hypothetical protein
MNWKCYVGSGMLFVGGLALGVASNGGGKYQEGRLSACKELATVMVQLNPLIVLAGGIDCVPYKGDAAIKIGEKLYSLDGTKQLN